MTHLAVNVVKHISKPKGVAEMTNKLKLKHVRKNRVNAGYKFYGDSSSLFIPWGFKAPAKSLYEDSCFSDRIT